MSTWKFSTAKHILWVVFILLLLLICIGGAYAASYTLRSGSETVTLKSISSLGGKIYITLEYKNDSSKAEMFFGNFGIDVWQNGRKCEQYYSGGKNKAEQIKDGASIEVSEVFSLRDSTSTSIIEIDVSEWFVVTPNEFIVFFNPKTQKWGTKQEVSAESTPSPKPTATPMITASPTPLPVKNVSEENAEFVWVCPSCGRELTSRFCPDCGTTSPTPQPTATPTPSPTPVPMDLSKPVENVVKYRYTVYEDDKETKGIYTGEIIDGFPHGYGVFECNAWIYVGEWSWGVRSDQGHLFNLYPGFVTRDEYYAVGNYVTFGTYPQTEEGDDATPIEWLVLARDGEKALLLSRHGLDTKPYNTERTDVTWETCTLRTWLNGTFVDSAFTATEQARILQTEVDNSPSQGYNRWSTSGGNNTVDRIFLLSYAEANRYLGLTVSSNDKYTKIRVSPTAYAVKQGATTGSSYKTADGEAAMWWWLRSPGSSQQNVADVNTAGSLHSSNVSNSYGCVRPALWIKLDSEIF